MYYTVHDGLGATFDFANGSFFESELGGVKLVVALNSKHSSTEKANSP